MNVPCLSCQKNRVSVRKTPDDTLGLLILLSQAPCEITVKHVGAGLILKWNHENPDRRVETGDKIVSVNGVRPSSGKAFMSSLKEDQEMDLVFRRCS